MMVWKIQYFGAAIEIPILEGTGTVSVCKEKYICISDLFT